MENHNHKVNRTKEAAEYFRRANAYLTQRFEERTEELESKNRKLEALNLKIRALTRKTQEALENDRRSIAMELHDSIGANLAAIKISLEQRLAEIDVSNQIDIISFEKILFYLMETIKEIKRLSHGLRPSTLDSLGLLVTISSHAKKLKEIYPRITFVLELTVAENDVPDPLKIVIFRILQEAMNNACLHSRANYVRVRLEKIGETLFLNISDNGCGFDSEAVTSSPNNMTGYGIQGMRDHVDIFDGDFLIESKKNEGTNIQVRLPCIRK